MKQALKKNLITFLLFLSCSFAFSQTVYITDTGEKYHNGTCRYLSKSKHAIALSQAIDKGYEACKVCSPPQLIKSEKTLPENDPDKSSLHQAVAAQCTATTKNGSRCKRMTKSANGLCWQHGGNQITQED